jgi:hypothetical protein
MEADFPVRFFGLPTADAATSGGGFSLIDGSMVLLASEWTTTVDGQAFPDGVQPDVVGNPWHETTEMEAWIRETAGC